MKKIIELELSKIKSEMRNMETTHLYHLTERWKYLRAQEMILERVIATSEKLTVIVNND